MNHEDSLVTTLKKENNYSANIMPSNKRLLARKKEYILSPEQDLSLSFLTALRHNKSIRMPNYTRGKAKKLYHWPIVTFYCHREQKQTMLNKKKPPKHDGVAPSQTTNNNINTNFRKPNENWNHLLRKPIITIGNWWRNLQRPKFFTCQIESKI